MARTRLRNERWGFESNCFVCEPTNAAGLRLPFDHDDELDAVVCDFELDDRFSGAPLYVHGGVTLALLDEAMAWATIVLASRFAMTVETTSRFLRPVKVHKPYTCTARVVGAEGDRLRTTAVVTDRFANACVEAEATFQVFSEAQAVDGIGEVTGDDARYLGG